jgi:hypothetical protein
MFQAAQEECEVLRQERDGLVADNTRLRDRIVRLEHDIKKQKAYVS